MKRLLLFLLSLIPLFGISQPKGFIKKPVPQMCGTSGNFPDVLRNRPKGDMVMTANGYVINVYFHLVRFTNGSGGQPLSIITTTLNNFASVYCIQGISFNNVGYDYINNDSFQQFDQNDNGTYNTLVGTNHVANAINIYLLDDNAAFQGGKSNGIPATALVVGGTLQLSPPVPAVPTLVVAHEMGHALGLYHTFETVLGSELVNESNCTTAGDLICDTNAVDPRYVFTENSSCAYTTNFTDANGDTYNPDAHNIMMYARPSCQQYFTNGQGGRMRSVIALGGILAPVLYQVPISGSNLVCTSNTFSVPTLPSGMTVTGWSTDNSLLLTINPTTGVATKAGNSYQSGIVHVLVTATNATCNSVATGSYAVFVGIPQFTVTLDGSACPYGPDCSSTAVAYTPLYGHTYTAIPTTGIGSTGTDTWAFYIFSGIPTHSSSGNTMTFGSKLSNSQFSIRAQATNSCGTSYACTFFTNMS